MKNKTKRVKNYFKEKFDYRAVNGTYQKLMNFSSSSLASLIIGTQIITMSFKY